MFPLPIRSDIAVLMGSSGLWDVPVGPPGLGCVLVGWGRFYRISIKLVGVLMGSSGFLDVPVGPPGLGCVLVG